MVPCMWPSYLFQAHEKLQTARWPGSRLWRLQAVHFQMPPHPGTSLLWNPMISDRLTLDNIMQVLQSHG